MCNSVDLCEAKKRIIDYECVSDFNSARQGFDSSQQKQTETFPLLLIHKGANSLCIRLNKNRNLVSLEFRVF